MAANVPAVPANRHDSHAKSLHCTNVRDHPKPNLCDNQTWCKPLT